MTKNNQLGKQQSSNLSPAERFTKTIVREAGENSVGGANLTEYTKGLLNGYFLQIDSYFKDPKRNRNNYSWRDVNMTDLAIQSVKYARLGLDMLQENTLHIVPYQSKHGAKVDVNLQLGYNAKKFLAMNYSIKPIKEVTMELVYSTDDFQILGPNNYIQKIKNPFNRGEIIGGFGYIEYADGSKPKLILVSKEELEKRRSTAKTQAIWNQWSKEMYEKTLVNIIYSQRNIPLDPRRIAEEMEFIREREAKASLAEAGEDAERNANAERLDFEESAYEAEYTVRDAEEEPAPETQEEPEDPREEKNAADLFDIDELALESELKTLEDMDF